MTTENGFAMKHDRYMESRYHGNAPVEKCRAIAAKELGVSLDSVYTVTFTFTLGSFKAFCSSSELHNDFGTYVEVVYNAEKNEYYVIRYEQTNRVTIHDN